MYLLLRRITHFTGDAMLFLFGMGVLVIGMTNYLFYECNRITQDCFVIGGLL